VFNNQLDLLGFTLTVAESCRIRRPARQFRTPGAFLKNKKGFLILVKISQNKSKQVKILGFVFDLTLGVLTAGRSWANFSKH